MKILQKTITLNIFDSKRKSIILKHVIKLQQPFFRCLLTDDWKYIINFTSSTVRYVLKKITFAGQVQKLGNTEYVLVYQQ